MPPKSTKKRTAPKTEDAERETSRRGRATAAKLIIPPPLIQRIKNDQQQTKSVASTEMSQNNAPPSKLRIWGALIN